MIRYKEIAFIAYPVTDIPRARKFYEGVLNLKPNEPLGSETPRWIEYDIGSGTLGIGSSPNWLPSQTARRWPSRLRTSMPPSRPCASIRSRRSADPWTCQAAAW